MVYLSAFSWWELAQLTKRGRLELPLPVDEWLIEATEGSGVLSVQHGVNDFVICCGYKGYVIKEYFANYFLHMSDVTFDMRSNRMEVHHKRAEPWNVTLVDTGDDSMTGGRLRRVAKYVQDEEAFCFTYGDGVGDIDISATIAFHRSHGKAATLTATYPPGRFGALVIRNRQVMSFKEKPKGDGALINGGFFVLSPLQASVDWHQQWLAEADMKAFTIGQIGQYQ